MTGLLTPILTFLLTATLKAAVLAVLVLLVRLLCDRLLTARARYRLWFVVILALVIKVGIEIPWPEFLPVRQAADSLVSAPVMAALPRAGAASPDFPTVESERTGNPGLFQKSMASQASNPVEKPFFSLPAMLALVWFCIGTIPCFGWPSGACGKTARRHAPGIVTGNTADQHTNIGSWPLRFTENFRVIENAGLASN